MTDQEFSLSRCLIFGAPVDITTQYRPGARFGPRGIRDSSMLFPIGPNGAYDPERDTTYLGPPWRMVDAGDADLVHGDLEQNLDSLMQRQYLGLIQDMQAANRDELARELRLEASQDYPQAAEFNNLRSSLPQ